MNDMKCPACEVSRMAERTIEGSVVYVCFSCLGVFLEKSAIDLHVNDDNYLRVIAAEVVEVDRVSFVDTLTSMRNRRFFDNVLTAQCAKAIKGSALALVMFDLDGFKEVNTEYGHAAGDRVLADFAKILREETRNIDCPARTGGDEFAVIMPVQASGDGAIRGAEALALRVITRTREASWQTHKGKQIKGIGATAGYAVFPHHTGILRRGRDAGILAKRLYERADEALLAAKEKEKGTVFSAEDLPPKEDHQEPSTPATAGRGKGNGGGEMIPTHPGPVLPPEGPTPTAPAAPPKPGGRRRRDRERESRAEEP